MRPYKVLSFDEAVGQITVSVDGFNPMAIDLPLIDGAYPVGTELDTYVMGFFPSYVLDRKAQIAQGVANAAEIAALVEAPDPSPQLTPEDLANQRMWAQVAFEKQVATALVKFGVLQSDPTAIGVTQL